MEQILIAFIDTLDASLKKLQVQLGDGSGLSKLTINQLHYLDTIHALGEPTLTQIADRMHITKASVTAGVHKLDGLGYVVKKQSSQDRRVTHVCLTEAGGHLVAAKYQALHEYGEFIRATLTEEEARQFTDILTKLVRLFGQNSLQATRTGKQSC